MKCKNVRLKKKDLFKGRVVYVVQGSLYPRKITIEKLHGDLLTFKEDNELFGQATTFDLRLVRPAMYAPFLYHDELVLAFFKTMEHAVAYRERRYNVPGRLGRDVEFINLKSSRYLLEHHALECYITKLLTEYK